MLLRRLKRGAAPGIDYITVEHLFTISWPNFVSLPQSVLKVKVLMHKYSARAMHGNHKSAQVGEVRVWPASLESVVSFVWPIGSWTNLCKPLRSGTCHRMGLSTLKIWCNFPEPFLLWINLDRSNDSSMHILPIGVRLRRFHCASSFFMTGILSWILSSVAFFISRPTSTLSIFNFFTKLMFSSVFTSSSGKDPIAMQHVFSIFIFKPDWRPNILNSPMAPVTDVSVPSRNKIVSSAYWLILISLLRSICIPLNLVYLIICSVKMETARLKRYPDPRSHCRIPLRRNIVLPRWLLTRTR